MTVPPFDARLQQRADTDLGDDPEDEAQGDPDGDGGTPAATKASISPPDCTPPIPRGTEGPSPDASSPGWLEQHTPEPLRCPEGAEEPPAPQTPGVDQPPPT